MIDPRVVLVLIAFVPALGYGQGAKTYCNPLDQ
jgi:hypothetical protein